MFREVFEKYSWNEVERLIYSQKKQDVIRVLSKERIDIDDFAVLLSPSAKDYLEILATRSMRLTRERFGNTIQMFAPFYLSNECQNICTYCGFSLNNKIPRKTLSDVEIVTECEVLKKQGFDHILIVTGEANKSVGMPYFLNALKIMKPYFSTVSMEVQPLEEDEYKALKESGVHSILVYQETYNEESYKDYHPKGKKSKFFYRLDTPDRIGKAKMHKIGIGSLLGLSDWRVDSFFTALHLNYLEKTYWESRYSLSFPRLRPFSGGKIEANWINEKELVQLICAFRIFNQELELSLSTRESVKFRNNALHLGITSMSAGSKTNPGGYSVEKESLEQFEINDDRKVHQVVDMIKSNGKEAVFKDWDKSYELIS